MWIKNELTKPDVRICTFPPLLVLALDNLDFLLIAQIVTEYHINMSTVSKLQIT